MKLGDCYTIHAVEKSILPSEISLLKSEIQLLKEQFDTVKPMISFAQAVQATDNEISIDDFCKITFEKLGYGRNTLFAELSKEKDIYKIGRVLQNTFIECGDVEMFIEVYFGVHYGMICDERPEIWNQMICSDKH